ncbi:MAG: ribonuclease III [Clostridia bacterium]|nr:ribonuclease III [Clostridia bacterium]
MHEKITGTALPSVMALSYLGDARHSLYVRRMLVGRGIVKSGELNEAALRYVTCEAQAEMMRRIEPRLLDDERDVYRRAANSSHLNKPKHASSQDYRAATGFEAVVGMLEWIGDTERLTELLDIAHGQTEI